MSPSLLWIARVAWRAWRKGSSEPRCSPRTEGTAGTQHPSLSHSIPHSYAQGHTGTFSPHGLACRLHVSAEAAVSGDSSVYFSLLPVSLSRCTLFTSQRNKSPRLRQATLFLWSSINSLYSTFLCLAISISIHSALRVRDWTLILSVPVLLC